jgi:squalene synthase HpnC
VTEITDDRQPRLRCTLHEAESWCRRLARSHYENFTVGSLLLPAALRQHVYNLYAYCRVADDLADEPGSNHQRLEQLADWRRQLEDCFRGEASHPVFVALTTTIERYDLPIEPLADLLVAFERDQTRRRYETHAELLDYCRYSANPVGRLMLRLAECDPPQALPLSDSICTGLQLANFWQDVARDFDAGRVYLPQEDCRHFGYTSAMFERREYNEAFVALLSHQVQLAEEHLLAGRPLLAIVPRWLRVDLAVFIEGGLATLRRIGRRQFDVWSARPTVRGAEKLQILARCWWQYGGRDARNAGHA